MELQPLNRWVTVVISPVSGVKTLPVGAHLVQDGAPETYCFRGFVPSFSPFTTMVSHRLCCGYFPTLQLGGAPTLVGKPCQPADFQNAAKGHEAIKSLKNLQKWGHEKESKILEPKELSIYRYPIVGCWTNPFNKNLLVKLGSSSPKFGVKKKTYLKPPPRYVHTWKPVCSLC